MLACLQLQGLLLLLLLYFFYTVESFSLRCCEPWDPNACLENTDQFIRFAGCLRGGADSSNVGGLLLPFKLFGDC